MGLVQAFYLLAMSALAGPLLYHLIFRNRPQRQVLPTMRFLMASAPQSYAMHRLKNLLLLALRLLILALIVLAFARPYFITPSATSNNAVAPVAAVFAVDRSLSMRVGDRWSEAASRMNTLIATVPDEGVLGLVLFDRTASVAVTATRDASLLKAAMRESEPGFGATDLVGGLRAAVQSASRMEAQRRRVFLISDFQSTGFRQIAMEMDLPSGVEIVPIRVGDDGEGNLALTGASEFPASRPGVRRVVARIESFLPRSGEAVIRLSRGGRRLASKRVSIDAGRIEAVDFELELDSAEEAIVTAELITKDALAEDNRFDFILPAKKALPLLVVVDSERLRPGAAATPDAPSDANPYLRAAVSACGSRVEPHWMSPARLGSADLSPYKALVAGRGAVADSAIAETLGRYVRSGGALILFAESGAPRALAELIGADIEGWTSVDRSRDEYRLVSARLSDGFEGLSDGVADSTGQSLLGHPKAYRYLQARILPDGGAEALLRFDDGSPFLLERRAGDGRVNLLTVPLDSTASDLVLKAAFTPFLYELMARAARGSRMRRDFTVGDILPSIGGEEPARLVGPDQSEVAMGPGTPRLRLPGIYEFTRAGASQRLQVNLDPEESDLKALDDRQIALLNREAAGNEVSPAGAAMPSVLTDDPEPDADGPLVLALILIAARFGEVATVITGFTIAHSITLAVAALGLAKPESQEIGALVGLSIVLVAAENAFLLGGRPRSIPIVIVLGLGAMVLLSALGFGGIGCLTLAGMTLFTFCYFGLLGLAERPARLRVAISFAFGLVHGFGFAGVLVEIALPRDRLVPALLGFNLGVEVGQLVLVAALWPLLRDLARVRDGRPHRLLVEVGSAAFCAASGCSGS